MKDVDNGYTIMSKGEMLQDDLDIPQYKQVYQEKYKSDFSKVIHEGKKITTDPNDMAELFDFDIGFPYALYLQILDEAKKLKLRKKIDIFNLREIAKSCTIDDVEGFSDLYKGIMKTAIRRNRMS